MLAEPHSVVTGRHLLVAVGLWLVAAVIVGTTTVLAAHRIGVADVTAIVVTEVYILLIATLVVVMRPRAAQALGLVRCRLADVGLAVAACGAAYFVTAALQSAGGPWPWTSAIEILKGMGSDDGRLATASPAIAVIIIVRACVLAAFAEEMFFRGVLYRVAATAVIGQGRDPRLRRRTCGDPRVSRHSSPRLCHRARLRLGA